MRAGERYSLELLRERFADLPPPLTADEALIEAARCLYCFDAPCTRACPTHIDVPKFIRQVLHGNNLGAAKTILDANKPDQATIDQMKSLREARENGTELTADQKAQFKAAREAQRTKMESIHQQILAVLTPEQKQQLDAKHQEMQKRWQDRRQNGTGTDKPATKPTSN